MLLDMTEPITPNKDALRQWVAALREPDRIQGPNRLCSIRPDGTKRQCCLDVLAEVAMNNGVPVTLAEVPHLYGVQHQYAWRNGGYTRTTTKLLPEPVSRWAGFSSDNPLVGNQPIEPYRAEATGVPANGDVTASAANDILSWTFIQIADSIEAFYGLLDADE